MSAARASEVETTYLTHDGIHDWPYVREDLRAAIDGGLFEPVPDVPSGWAYRTVAQTGEAWGMRFSFARPPEEVVTLRRDGDRLSGEGGGTVTITVPGDCDVTAELPFEVAMPASRCTDGRIRLRVAPARVSAGKAARLRIRATTLLRGRTAPVPGARVRVRGRSLLTGRDGRVSVTVGVSPRRRLLRVVVTKPGLRSAKATVRVRRR